MGQPSLFDQLDDAPKPPPHTIHRGPVGAPYSNPTTSKQAAERIAGHMTEQQAQYLGWLRDRGAHGATDEEAAAGTGLSPNALRPRRGECFAKGLIADSGRTRKTLSQRNAIVWVAAEFAEARP